MKRISKQLFLVGGALVVAAGLLAFSLRSADTSFGHATDVPAEPPPSIVDGQPPEGSTLSVNTETQEAVLGATVPVNAAIVDAEGNPAPGVECSFAVKDQPGSDASVAAGPITTDVEGIAHTTLNVGNTEGTIVVGATCGDLAAEVSVVAGAQDTNAGALPAAGDGGITGSSPVSLWLLAVAAAGVLLAGAGWGLARETRRTRDQ
jgi:hypothetical protein